MDGTPPLVKNFPEYKVTGLRMKHLQVETTLLQVETTLLLLCKAEEATKISDDAGEILNPSM